MNLKNNSYKMRYLLLLSIILSSISSLAQQTIRVGAKHFNEGYILSEIISQLLENEGIPVERKFNLGGTTIAFEALKNGDIDIYPEYTGTIANEILNEKKALTHAELQQAIQLNFNLQVSKPYGFNNTYALVVPLHLADKFQLKNISDLAKHPDVSAGLSHEFINRKDGWQSLAEYYHLQNQIKGIEHSLAYTAITNNEIDFTDAYSTDGEITKMNLFVLTDDKGFFPKYEAVSFYSNKLPPEARAAIKKIENAITETEMQKMNAEVLYNKKDFYTVARSFLLSKHLIQADKQAMQNSSNNFLSHVWQHLLLTFLSLLVSLFIALPLGIFLHSRVIASKPILFATSILQTIPSIALLALFIPVMGIGKLPAIVALSLYAILPILRNTITGLQNVNSELLFVAKAIGLNEKQILYKVKLPLAFPAIISGVRIAAVINVGTATLAAFIGAGGLGEYIVTGLALNNTSLILKGAIPSAILAIAIELVFDVIEKRKKAYKSQ